MKKNILLALIAALALSVGLGSVAVAGVDSGAQASAKKGKGCKGKGKGKAGKSASASAKGKGKGCKGKGAANGAWPPADGVYQDSKADTQLTIGGNGKTAAIEFPAFSLCVPLTYSSDPLPLKVTATGLSASENTQFLPAGVPVDVQWSISVKKPSLDYVLNFSMKAQGPLSDCETTEKITGTLVKVG